MGSGSQLGKTGTCYPLCIKGSTPNNPLMGSNPRYTIKEEAEYG